MSNALFLFICYSFLLYYICKKQEGLSSIIVKDKRTELHSWQIRANQYINKKQYNMAAVFLESLLLDAEKNKPNDSYNPQVIYLYKIYYIQTYHFTPPF